MAGSDGVIDFDVQTDSSSVVEDVTRLVTQLERAFTQAQGLRNEFYLLTKETRDNEAAQAKVLAIIEDMRATSAAMQRAQQTVLNGSSPNGGTLRDDQLKNFQVGAITTAINTSVEQVQARLIEASTKATERMIKTTAEAIQARLTKLNVGQQNEIATFGSGDYVSAVVNRNRINAQKVVRDYGAFGSLDEKDAAARAEKEAAAARAAQEKNEAYLHSLRTKHYSDEQKQRERDAQLLLNIQLNTAKKIEAERVAAEKAADAQMWSGLRRQSSLMAAEQKRLERDNGLQAKAEKRAEYAASPEARADAFENRMRIFSDYATIGLSVYALKNMLSTVVDLEDAMKRFQAITQTTDTEMRGFNAQMLKLGETSRYSMRDLVETATLLGQTGLSADAVAKTIPAITNLATASGSTLKEATDAITAAMGAYNMQAHQATDVADIMTAALNRTKLNMTQLSQGISVAANISRDAGISFSELTAVIASLAQAGIRSGSTIGTGTRQLIQELEAPSDKLKNTLAVLGISLGEIDLKSNGLIGVLENLRDKGFGTSEALRSLDLRAAAAFSALSGRLDRAKQLQEVLLLTSASSEGAAKASESLSTAWQRTLNTATGLATQGFAPIIEALKVFTSLVGGTLSAMNSLGVAIPLLTGGLVALGSALALAQFAKVTQGILLLALPAVQTAAAITGLSTALSFLAANPLIVAGVLGGGILVSALFGGPGKLEEKIDKINSVMNDLTSRQQQVESTISSLDTQITNVINKKEKLNADPILRRTAILEAQKQFEGLSGMVSSSAGKIDDLIDAMRRLRAEMSQSLPSNFAAQILELDKRIKAKTEKSGEADKDIFGSMREKLGLEDFFFSGINKSKLQQFVTQGLGPNFGAMLDAIGSDKSTPDQLGGYQLELLRKRTALLQEKESGKDVEGALKIVDALSDALNDKVKRLNDIRGDVLTREQAARNLKVSTVQETDGYQDLISSKEGAYDRLRRGVDSINGDPLLSNNQREDRFRILRQLAANDVAQIDEQLREFERQQKAAGADDETLKNALAQFKADLEGIRKGASGGLADAHKALQTLNVQRDQKATQSEIQQLTAALNDRSSTSDVDLTQQRVAALIEKERQLALKLIELKAANPERLSPEEQGAIEAANREFDAKNAQMIEAMSERRKKIVDRILTGQMSVLKAQEGRLNTEISSLEKELARPGTTAERAAELRKKIDELIKQASDLIEQQKGLSITRDTRNLPKDYFSNGSATGVAKQIIDSATGANQTSLLAYLLNMAQAESGMGKAKDPRGWGLFQFDDETWKSYGGGDRGSVEDQVRNALKKIAADRKSFQGRFGRGPDDEELYTLWQQGSAGGMALNDPANAKKLAVDVLRSFYDNGRERLAVTQNGGRTDMTVEEFLEVVKGHYRKNATTADKYLTSSEGLARDKAIEEANKGLTELADKSRKAGDSVKKKEYDEQMLRDRALNKADEQSIKTNEALLKRTTDPADAQRLALEITGSIKGLMDRAVKDYLAKPENAEKTKEQQNADLDAIRAPFIERVQREAVTTTDLVAKRIVEVQQRLVDRLTLQASEMEKNPGKFSAAEISKNDIELKLAQRQLEVETQIASKKEAMSMIDRQMSAIKGAGMATEEQLTELKERQALLEKEIGELEKKRAIQARTDATSGGVGKALDTGSYNFFKSAGMLNARGEFKSLTEDISDMWQKAMGAMSSGLSTFFTDIFSGTKKASVAFRDLATSILKSMMQIVSQALANQILRAIFGGGIFGGAGDFLGGLFGGGGGGGLAPFAHGGPVRLAGGGGFAASNRDSVHALLDPGEYVIRTTAVDAIGRDNLDALNSLGSNRVSKSLDGAKPAASEKPGAPHHTNVWVVSPDQVPPPSENDIIATVSRDIQNRGPLRTLVKSVVVGGN